MESKAVLRKRLRQARRAHVAALDPRTRALLLSRPPAAALPLVPPGATIGLYVAGPDEAPATGYARYFHDAGHRLALPWFATRDTPMQFREWVSPYIDSALEPGPYGIAQPNAAAAAIEPDILFVPLVGFTADGGRLGQGGGHYDRWLAVHPAAHAIGLAWDCQLCTALPSEPHDRALAAIITPTRLYGPFVEHIHSGNRANG